MALVVGATCLGTAIAQPIVADSPAASVQQFFDYLLTPRANIVTDVAAQETWLAPSLRTLLVDAAAAVAAARALPEVDGPDPAVPDNGSFLDSWDFPTSCRAARAVPAGDRAQVAVLCRWGKATQYPGATRQASVALVKDGGAWRIADVRLQKSRYAEETDLVQMLESLRQEAQDLSRAHGRPGADPR